MVICISYWLAFCFFLCYTIIRKWIDEKPNSCLPDKNFFLSLLYHIMWTISTAPALNRTGVVFFLFKQKECLTLCLWKCLPSLAINPRVTLNKNKGKCTHCVRPCFNLAYTLRLILPTEVHSLTSQYSLSCGANAPRSGDGAARLRVGTITLVHHPLGLCLSWIRSTPLLYSVSHL